MNTKEFDRRYKVVAKLLGDLSDKVILDLNCGQAGFRKFIKYKRYIANDVFLPDDIKIGKFWEFLNMSDKDVDVKSDIIVLFGYGGGEFTGEPLESKTAGESLVRLAKKYRPEYVVVEMCQKWENDFKIMTNLEKELSDFYRIQFAKKIDMGEDHYHLKRLIKIFRIKE